MLTVDGVSGLVLVPELSWLGAADIDVGTATEVGASVVATAVVRV